MIITASIDGRTKPVVHRYALNRSHRLAQGLVLAVVPLDFTPVDLVSGQVARPIGASVPAITGGNEGVAIAGSAAWKFTDPTLFDAVTSPATIFVIGRNPTNASEGNIIESSENSFGDGCGFRFDDINMATNSFMLWGDNARPAAASSDALGANAELRFHRAAVTWDGTNIRFYVRGKLDSSPANTFAANANTNRRTRIFADFNEGLTVNHQACLIYAWNRALSNSEIAALAEAPYQLLDRPHRVFVGEAGATAYTLTADAGTYAITGTAATLKAARLLSANAGSYAQTGTAASLEHGFTVQANGGTFVVTGTAAGTRKASIVNAASGTFTVSGTAAALRRTGIVAAGSGAYSVNGTDATLVYDQVGSFTLVANGGTYAVTGTAATLEADRRIVATGGSYAVSGTAATLIHANRQVTALSGSFLFTGTAAALTPSAVHIATVGISESLVTNLAVSESLVTRVTITETLIA